jgi:hypothetical protein
MAWHAHRGRDPDKELLRLKGRFRAVSRRHEFAMRLRRFRRRARVWALAGSGAIVVYAGLATLSPPPPMVTLRHVVASRNCDAAREMGLAPAHRGQPGYWPSHDRDRDGIACEPWSRLRR